MEPNQKTTQFVQTSNLHLATLLGTLGARPLQIVRGPGITRQGDMVVRWQYESSKSADEIMFRWQNPKDVEWEWETLTDREKELIFDVVSAFCANLRHFLAHTKNSK